MHSLSFVGSLLFGPSEDIKILNTLSSSIKSKVVVYFVPYCQFFADILCLALPYFKAQSNLLSDERSFP